VRRAAEESPASAVTITSDIRMVAVVFIPSLL
jgi:hypothetical protein